MTVRTKLDRLVGGATEETIIARVGEGIVKAIGSAEHHTDVLANPNLISQAVLKNSLDSQTAFEIVSIDVAEIDVGENIGANLQADQAAADLRVAQAKAEKRRALAVAREQEMRATVEENRAKVVLAEAEVPLAIAAGVPRRPSRRHGLLQPEEPAIRHADAQRHRRRRQQRSRRTQRHLNSRGSWIVDRGSKKTIHDPRFTIHDLREQRMQWELLIIPLIAVGVWILGTLFKTGEEEIARKGARRPGSPSGRTTGRRPVTDLDRFLEDARRRREKEERQKVSAEPPPQPTISRPPLSDRPARPRTAASDAAGSPRRRSACRNPGCSPRVRAGRASEDAHGSRARRAARAALQRSAAHRAHHHTRYPSLADRAAGAFAVEQTAHGGNGFRAARNLRSSSVRAPALRRTAGVSRLVGCRTSRLTPAVRPQK